MTDHLKRAMQLAHDRGMTLVTLHHTDRLADIFCATCGWPKTHRETVIDQYANEPYGCHPCSWSAEYGRPCSGLPQQQDRAV